MSSGTEWGASFASASTSALSYYDDIMVPRLFDPWATLLLDELNPQSGQSVLDVACGPGTVTRQAAQRVGPSGKVTGCDLSAAMLEIARSKVAPDASAPIDYVECSADALTVSDRDFDLITCQQGLQFFPNRPAALDEMRRALRPGGRLGLAVWCDIEQCPPFAALGNALEHVFGAPMADAYRSGPWGFGDPDALHQLVSDGGFEHVRMRHCEWPLVFEGGPSQLQLTLRVASVSTTLAALPESELNALASSVDEFTRSITFDGVIQSYASAHLVTATAANP